MKTTATLLLLVGLATGVATSPARAQMMLSGPVAMAAAPVSLQVVSLFIPVSPGAAPRFEGQPKAETNSAACRPFADPDAPLPVQLSAFTVQRQGSSAHLSWTTTTEENNIYFAVERSLDGVTFERVGRVIGQGYSAVRHDYQFEETNVTQPSAPTRYYRLRQVDNQGQATYSAVRLLQMQELAVRPAAGVQL